MKKELYLGLDVHKDCIITAEAATADKLAGRKGEVRESRCAQQRSARGGKVDWPAALSAWQRNAERLDYS